MSAPVYPVKLQVESISQVLEIFELLTDLKRNLLDGFALVGDDIYLIVG